MGTVVAVCTSPAKGTQKTDVKEAVFIEDFGIEGDAHAGKWHRQISLLSYDKIRAFQERGARVGHGAFGENLVVEGIDFRTLPVGTRLDCGDVVLEITQIGNFRWERDWTAVMWYWRSPRSEKSAITAAGYFRRWGIASCPGKASSRKWSGAV